MRVVGGRARRGIAGMRWNWFIVSCGVAVVALGFALAFLDGAHQAIERAEIEAADRER